MIKKPTEIEQKTKEMKDLREKNLKELDLTLEIVRRHDLTASDAIFNQNQEAKKAKSKGRVINETVQYYINIPETHKELYFPFMVRLMATDCLVPLVCSSITNYITSVRLKLCQLLITR